MLAVQLLALTGLFRASLSICFLSWSCWQAVMLRRRVPCCCWMCLQPLLSSAQQHLPCYKRSFLLQHGIAKLKRILEGEGESNFDAEMYMRLYT